MWNHLSMAEISLKVSKIWTEFTVGGLRRHVKYSNRTTERHSDQILRDTQCWALYLHRGRQNCAEWRDEIENFVWKYRSELYFQSRDFGPLSHEIEVRDWGCRTAPLSRKLALKSQKSWFQLLAGKFSRDCVAERTLRYKIIFSPRKCTVVGLVLFEKQDHR